MRISQTALNKAGALGLERAVRKEEGENLAGLLKFMVENSALATGRTRHARKPDGSRRRRYGDIVLILRNHVVVDVAVLRPDYCPECLGVDNTPCICN